MKKVMICMVTGFLFAVNILHAQDSARVLILKDSLKKLPDAAIMPPQPTDSLTPKQKTDTVSPKQKSADKKPVNNISVKQQSKDTTGNWQIKDVTEENHSSSKRDVDTRWFISPLCKFQVQDFGLLEKNHYGYLSNANTLSFQQKSNMSASLSAYKNITNRFAFSADFGLSFGHVTSSSVLVSQTKSKTYNLLNATVYYHLLSAGYRLQPFVSLGINDLINATSYPSMPVGVGVKFNSKKLMITGQAAYGYSVSKNIANTMMYSVGMYLPINTRKSKMKQEAEPVAQNKPKKEHKKKNKDDDKDDSDSTSSKNNAPIVNNIYININMDSLVNAKNGGRKRGTERFDPLDLNEFTPDDYKIDSLEGQAQIKFVVYFEYNMYSLNSGAFIAIDKVLAQIKRNPGLIVEIKGYTDDVGTQEYNLFLSRMRAQMVFDYMNSRGIPSDKMGLKFYGKENPVADNNDPKTSWLNRRAEIVIRRK
jgi:outer membrane protein OmpA-like peptidoglycan-associated protein